MCRITMDTLTEAAIIVYKHNGDQLKLKESRAGLYYYDAKPSSTHLNDYTLAQSVNDNKSLYTWQQLVSAKLAKRVIKLVGRPSHATFMEIICKHQLHNCPITVNDANRAKTIYSTEVAALREKTTRKTPAHVPLDQLCPIPASILDSHKNVSLCFDICFVYDFVFLGTVSRNLYFIKVEHIQTRGILKHLLPSLNKVNHIYKARGFQIRIAHADDEFSSLPHPLLALDKIALNIAATNQHVPEIECAILTIKESNRSAISNLPYKHYPKLLKVELILLAVSWLNMFPHTNSVSDHMSPCTLLTSITANYNVASPWGPIAKFTTNPIQAPRKYHAHPNQSPSTLPATCRAVTVFSPSTKAYLSFVVDEPNYPLWTPSSPVYTSTPSLNRPTTPTTHTFNLHGVPTFPSATNLMITFRHNHPSLPLK
jgi:hypothetical protein